MKPASQRLYFDSALIAKFYANEPGRDVVRQTAQSAGSVCSSAISIIEVSAAFHRKLREKNIDAIQFEALQAQFSHDLDEGLWVMFPVSADLIQSARILFSKLQSTVYLRSLDALHLVTAASGNFGQIFSNDKQLLAASRHAEITGINPLA